MKSNTIKLFTVSIVMAYALLVVGSVMAQDATAPAAAPAAATAAVESKAPPMPPPLELRKTGVVSVTKDASGKITSIKLVVTSYDIILDEGSKPLESMDGQKVRVTGTFSMQDTRRCFTVKNVEPVADASVPAAKPAAAPAAPAQ
ncbi:MAG: hypothetical protein KKG09_01690 [Verrucomicrobia bacterium]|nr:hypothetical protein [Verrucomicrobiota bacterium]MBU4292388.1 hypothetical protein [Verrucomicrobiota bacterium]MBU4429080.1 hypothetical protein [Verrucomicrobiota bacterium]MBU4496706.1 hypothetical protein [Verrucomicrobiota bacterium]MCG2679108.1 hypothetical protein [Kiritimatiellia bacterium]